MATTLMPLDPATSPQRALRVLPIQANLLPVEVLAARRARRVRGQVLVLLSIVVVLLGAWYGFTVLRASDAQAELDTALTEATVLRQQQRTYAEQTTVDAELTAIGGKLEVLLAEDLRWSTLFGTLRSAGTTTGATVVGVTGGLISVGTAQASGLPDTAASDVVASLTVNGKASGKPAVAAYADELRKSDLIANVTVTNVSGDAKAVQFTMQVDVTRAALGGRFSPQSTPAPGGK